MKSRAYKATYRSWWGMRDRCLRESARDYRWYGARGITVCDRWASFEAFHADMGERPEGRTLDRIDNSGNYEPANCRWATKAQQARNSRGVKLTQELADAIRLVVAAGMPQSDLADGLGLHPTTIRKVVHDRAWLPGDDNT